MEGARGQLSLLAVNIELAVLAALAVVRQHPRGNSVSLGRVAVQVHGGRIADARPHQQVDPSVQRLRPLPVLRARSASRAPVTVARAILPSCLTR